MDPVIGGLVSTGASVLGNLFNWWQNDEQREYERQQQDRQWRLALEQWNRENQYNLPSAQMARLRAAGINPHLAFANGDVMNEGAASPSVPDAHQVQPYTVDPLTIAQVQKLNAETKSIEDANARENQLQPSALESLQATVKETNQRITQMVEGLNGIKLDNEYKELQNMVFDATKSYLISASKSDALLKQDQWFAFQEGFQADLGLKRAQASYYRSLKSLTDEQRNQVEFMVDMAKQMWDVDRQYYRANAHNQYVLGYITAKNARQANEFWNENKDADWWMDHITESLNTLFRGVEAGASAYAAYRSGDKSKAYSIGHSVVSY